MTNDAASKQYGKGWKEVYSGGSPEAEAMLFATFTDQIKRVQAQIKQPSASRAHLDPFNWMQRQICAELRSGWSRTREISMTSS